MKIVTNSCNHAITLTKSDSLHFKLRTHTKLKRIMCTGFELLPLWRYKQASNVKKNGAQNHHRQWSLAFYVEIVDEEWDKRGGSKWDTKPKAHPSEVHFPNGTHLGAHPFSKHALRFNAANRRFKLVQWQHYSESQVVESCIFQSVNDITQIFVIKPKQKFYFERLYYYCNTLYDPAGKINLRKFKTIKAWIHIMKTRYLNTGSFSSKFLVWEGTHYKREK